MRREPYTQGKNLTGNGGAVRMVACSRLVMMLTLFFDKRKPNPFMYILLNFLFI